MVIWRGTIESWVGVVSLRKKAMDLKDARTIMILFATFVPALLTYTGITTRESKNPLKG